MIHFKKIVILCCAVFCFIIIISFSTKQKFYVHNEEMPIQQIKITKIFSTPSLAGENNIETVLLQDKKEINDMISKLNSYTFHKKISFEKIKGIPSTTENMTQFFIDISYDKQQKHFDRISVVCTENMAWKNIEIVCGEKRKKGKVSNETMKQFLEDMQLYFNE